MSKIVSIATNVSQYRHDQNDICVFADKIYNSNADDSRKYKFMYNRSGIQTRYSVIPDYHSSVEKREFFPKTKDLEPFPDMDMKMKCFAKHAAPLSIKTIEDCIAGKITKNEITHLITVSCTGMSSPGLDLDIMEKMNLRRNIFRTSVNFMGCYAAIHALKMAHALCRSSQQANVVIVCTELCTLHFQKENTMDNITSTILFGDGCAAVLVQKNTSTQKGIRLNNFFSHVAFNGKKEMSWNLSSSGFSLTLSGYVADLVKEDFNEIVLKALQESNLTKEDITHWCIHPGGKKILEAIDKGVGLAPASLRYSYDILKNYGNMSSCTILFVLQKIMNELLWHDKPAKIFAAAFGPGLTMETFIAAYD